MVKFNALKILLTLSLEHLLFLWPSFIRDFKNNLCAEEPQAYDDPHPKRLYWAQGLPLTAQVIPPR